MATAPSSFLITGQAKVAVTSTAVRLSGFALHNGVVITANPTNTAPIVIGVSGVANTANGSGTGYVLAAGASVSISISSSETIFINGTANDWVSFLGN